MSDPGLPTMQDVAREADVSLGTVSNVLNNPAKVAPSTRERVNRAIARLGYIRNSAARDLRRLRADGVGLIVPDIVNELFIGVARGAQIVAQQRGLSLLMANAVHSFASLQMGAGQIGQQDQFLDYFAEARTRGILLSPMSDPTAGITRIRDHVRPIVVINYDQPNADWCTVLMDNEQAGRLAAEHISGLGIERAYFVSVADVAQPIAARRRGLHEAARRTGLEVVDVATTGLRPDDGRAAAVRILSRGRRDPFAIIGVTDALALGALTVLRMHPDIVVPDDVAVMGLDGNHHGEDSDWMTLTSIELPGYQMGAEAVRLVLDEAAPQHRHQRVKLATSIRLGQSTTRDA